MQQQDISTLYDYSCWATGRVLSTARRLTTEQFVTPVVPEHGSLRATLVHTLSAERTWRMRCQEGVSPTSPLAEADFASVDALAERWREEEARMRGYLAGLSEEALGGLISYRTTKGVPYEDPLWLLLMQVVNHATQHRSEAALMLTVYGASPGNLDLSVYLREQH
jgi:uncharacterized damage-inducible protein DinB